MIPISLSAENMPPNETGWHEGFLRLCHDICGSQNNRFHDEETHHRGSCCPYCGNPIKVQGATGHGDRKNCEKCRRRIIDDILRLKDLIRKTQENARYLLGVETDLELHVEKKSLNGFFRGWRGSPATGSSFFIHKEESNRKPKHMATLKGTLPDAVIEAEVIRYLCLAYLKQNFGKVHSTEALADWFKVHYLFLIDRRDYARSMDNQLQGGKNAEGYQAWVQKLNSPLSARIVSMNHIGKIDQEAETLAKPELAPEGILQESTTADGNKPGQDEREVDWENASSEETTLE